MRNILLVEDDKALNTGIKMALEDNQTFIHQAYMLSEAREIIKEKNIRLVILDVNLPDGSGLTLLEEIKNTCRVPVILLTANDLEIDVVSGLAMGADDYITKPFSLAILRARVEVQFRKSSDIQEILIGDYRFDFEGQRFYNKDELVELSITEQKILKLLIKNKGKAVEREHLETYIWNDGYHYVDANTLSVAVKRLRTKLRDSTYLKTVYGVGYRWEE